MSRPGVEVYSSAAAPPLGVPTDTSVAFVVSEAQQGPTDAPSRLTSLDDYTNTYGDRVPGVEGYDACDAAFREGVTTIYYMRLADSGAKVATGDAATLAAGNTLNAANAGTWGNALEVKVVATPGGDDGGDGGNGEEVEPSGLLDFATPAAAGPTFLASVYLNGKAVQTSQELVTRRDLSNFLQQATYVTIVGPDDDTPLAAGDVSLAGGADGTLPVAEGDDSFGNALDAIPKTLGPGQLLAPGRSDVESHSLMLLHCQGRNRYALLDGAATDGVTELTSAAAALRGSEQDRYGMLWGPWAIIPGIAQGTQRTVPWSAIQAGLIARNDKAGNPNQAAAGTWGSSLYALGLTQAFTESECEQLLYAGVCTARTVYNEIQAYAFRSLSSQSGSNYQWWQANWGRLAMAIVAQGERVGQSFVFSQLDGRGLTIAAFGGQLGAVCKEFLDDGALFTDPDANGDPTTAYRVNVGPAVNTVESLSDGKLIAVLSVRMSPHAELVQIYIVKTDITVALV